jgi:hypothetical protein
VAKQLSERSRQLRYELVEALVNYVKQVGYSDEDVAELTKQTIRVAKFLGSTNISLSPAPQGWEAVETSVVPEDSYGA